MNSVKTWHTINPTPDEMLAAYDAFGELPTMDVLPRLIIARRAVAAGFYNDHPPLSSPAKRSRAVSKVRRSSRTSTSARRGTDTDGTAIAPTLS